MFDTVGRLRQILEERGWSEYRLAKESGLHGSTIKNIYKRNTQPTIETLEAICGAFGITLAQFFTVDGLTELTPEQKDMFSKWVDLTPSQKHAVDTVVQAFSEK